jgi:hypothetical protein
MHRESRQPKSRQRICASAWQIIRTHLDSIPICTVVGVIKVQNLIIQPLVHALVHT